LHRILDKSSNQNKLNGYTWPYHDNVGTNWYILFFDRHFISH
jgi:hypothetical protein